MCKNPRHCQWEERPLWSWITFYKHIWSQSCGLCTETRTWMMNLKEAGFTMSPFHKISHHTVLLFRQNYLQSKQWENWDPSIGVRQGSEVGTNERGWAEVDCDLLEERLRSMERIQSALKLWDGELIQRKACHTDLCSHSKISPTCKIHTGWSSSVSDETDLCSNLKSLFGIRLWNDWCHLRPAHFSEMLGQGK